MPNGLKVDDLCRAERAGEQIAEPGEIPTKPAQPVDVCFWSQTANQVLQAGADDELEHMRPGEGSLARQVDRIGHLGISHADSGDAADLGAEMNSACIRDVNDRPENGQLPGEIPVLVPSIQREGLIEAEIVLSDGSQAEAHVTSVSEEDRADLLLALSAAAGGDDRFSLDDGEPGALHIVCKHPAGGSHHIRVLLEKALSDS